jgi:small nuclear ribonucleoprotein (snRNP)-like protein
MNLVLDDAEEVYVEKAGKEAKPRQDLGKSFLSLTYLGV